jgi:dihydroorotase
MKRRDFVRMCGAAACVSPLAMQKGHGQAAPASDRYDLLVKGGRVLDPSQSLDKVADVAIADGKIAAIEPNIDRKRARRIIQVPGSLVTPGLIDIHVHGFQGISHWGVDLDRFCIGRGVTTAVDAGSSGADSFEGFRRYIINPAKTQILAFLNISRIGLIARPGELTDMRMVDVAAAQEAAIEHADVIVGMKVRCSAGLAGPNEVEAVRRTRAVAEKIGKPIMMHVGPHEAPLEKLLELLRPGDMMTHSFRDAGGVIGENGRVADSIKRAAKRGVRFDIGHGSGGFSFAAMEQALSEGLPPSSISSDIHTYSAMGPVFDLPTTMSKMLLLGLSLQKVIELSTIEPARAIHRDNELGSIKPGRVANIAVLNLVEGKFPLIDSKREVREASQKLVPVLALRNGKLTPGA